MIGLESSQTLLQLPSCLVSIARPCLGGDPHLVPTVTGDFADAFLRLAPRVYPGSIEVAYPAIQSTVHDSYGFLLRAATAIDNALGTKAEDR